jgi:LysM repeat protein
MRRLTIVLAILGLVAASSAGASSYTVKRGDTLGGIAKRVGTSVSSLVHGNALKDADHIVIGQVLKVGDTKSSATAPATATAPTTYTVKRGDSLGSIAKRNHTTVSALLKLNGLKNADHVLIGQTLKLTAPAPAPAKPASPALKPISSVHAIAGGLPPTHIVTKGENAAKIAKNFKVSTTSLAKANPGVDLRYLAVGMPLRIPVASVWICPVQGKRGFDDTWGARRPGNLPHLGTDIISPRGTAVVAPLGGTLELRPGGRIGGNAWYLHADDGNTYYGAHLDGYTAGAGRIEAGQQIGIVGDTGDAKGGATHLHFEFHPHGGEPVDPFFTLEAWC